MVYKPGSFFVVDVPGLGGFWIGVAQSLAGDASRYKHCGVILDEQGSILEAEPSGARIASISQYAGDGLLICDGPVRSFLSSQQVVQESAIRRWVVAEARKLVGTPYSWLDYAALAALHLHLPSRWIRRRVESSGHAMCSQLVDLCYLRAGVHLFDDGRLPGDVMPSDLAAWAEDYAARGGS